MTGRHIVDFNTALGLRLGADGETIELLAKAPEHQIGDGMVHLAVLTTLGEVAAAHAVNAPVVPSALTVNFLRPAPIGPLTAKGKVLVRGRRLATAEGEVSAEGKLVAKVTVTFAMVG
ncbi:MAG: PaaI family thioesterase [Planctomycetes bacterium]|nr:PaaI family thioesterase [Planctomycetota bacterium]